jgi:tRNA dimethylallyltransferase
MAGLLVAIVGATASGKTALAVDLAQRFGGEIVSADSRQVYRGMDIGTAKPGADDQQRARHWLIDAVAPDEEFGLATYLDLANAALEDIESRGVLPIIAGGTGQYVWALLEGWRVPRVAPDWKLRVELELIAARGGHEALFELLRSEDPQSATTIEPRNTRRVIRALEVTRATGRPFSAWQEKDPPDRRTCVLGLHFDREMLYGRIDERVDAMYAAGFVDEVRALLNAGYSCALRSMCSIGYREVCEHLAGRCTLADAVTRTKTETHRLARMQHTWFRHDAPRIRWLDGSAPRLADDAVAIISAAASG